MENIEITKFYLLKKIPNAQKNQVIIGDSRWVIGKNDFIFFTSELVLPDPLRKYTVWRLKNDVLAALSEPQQYTNRMGAHRRSRREYLLITGKKTIRTEIIPTGVPFIDEESVDKAALNLTLRLVQQQYEDYRNTSQNLIDSLTNQLHYREAELAIIRKNILELSDKPYVVNPKLFISKLVPRNEEVTEWLKGNRKES